MSADSLDQLNELTKAVRACYQRLTAVGEHLHAGLDASIAMRAVLESLAEHGAETVPQIARRKSVTRQYIQVIADALVAKGLVEYRENPAHRRSALLAITAKGENLFAQMRARERRLFAPLAADFRPAELVSACHAIGSINEFLDAQMKEIANDTADS